MEIREHQNDRSVNFKSRSLTGVNIGFCIGGGIAAIEVPKVARELRRLGATVRIFATEASLKFVGTDALEWASANSVTIHATGMAEHVSESDAVLIFPATADLIGKAAHGICPDACTTYIQSALGREQPVVFLPTMHESLASSPATLANIKTLEGYKGVEFIQPRKEEGKWKAPSPESIALEIAFRVNRLKFTKKSAELPHALVTLGGTSSKIDVARTVSNFSTGTLGGILIRKLLENGIQTTALCGNHNTILPSCSGLCTVPSVEFEDMEQNLQRLTSETIFSALFHLAAISDYGPKNESKAKIPSDENYLNLELKRLPKLIAMNCLSSIEYKIACKFTAGNTESERDKARSMINRNKLNTVIWNWGKTAFGLQDKQEFHLLETGKSDRILHSKDELAESLVSNFLEFLERRK